MFHPKPKTIADVMSTFDEKFKDMVVVGDFYEVVKNDDIKQFITQSISEIVESLRMEEGKYCEKHDLPQINETNCPNCTRVYYEGKKIRENHNKINLILSKGE